jgi:metal-responsive CopG/Arc/MetJ family transcriptional regulator
MADKTNDADGQSERLQMRVSRRFIRAVDDWRRHQPDIPSRSEAIRRLVEKSLEAEGEAPQKR